MESTSLLLACFHAFLQLVLQIAQGLELLVVLLLVTIFPALVLDGPADQSTKLQLPSVIKFAIRFCFATKPTGSTACMRATVDVTAVVLAMCGEIPRLVVVMFDLAASVVLVAIFPTLLEQSEPVLVVQNHATVLREEPTPAPVPVSVQAAVAATRARPVFPTVRTAKRAAVDERLARAKQRTLSAEERAMASKELEVALARRRARDSCSSSQLDRDVASPMPSARDAQYYKSSNAAVVAVVPALQKNGISPASARNKKKTKMQRAAHAMKCFREECSTRAAAVPEESSKNLTLAELEQEVESEIQSLLEQLL